MSLWTTNIWQYVMTHFPQQHIDKVSFDISSETEGWYYRCKAHALLTSKRFNSLLPKFVIDSSLYILNVSSIIPTITLAITIHKPSWVLNVIIY